MVFRTFEKNINSNIYIFLAFLFLVFLICDFKINIKTWLFNIIPICGLTETYIPGCGHLWFITNILICYFTVPLIKKANTCSKMFAKMLFPCYLLVVLTSLYILPIMFITLIHSLASFLIGFYILPKLIKCKFIFLPLFVFSVVVRLTVKSFFDGSPFYNNFIVGVTHNLLAIAIIIGLNYLLCLCENNKFCVALCDLMVKVSRYTFEFYIVHLILLFGNLEIQVFNQNVFNIILAFLLSCICSLIINYISTIVLNLLRRNK